MVKRLLRHSSPAARPRRPQHELLVPQMHRIARLIGRTRLRQVRIQAGADRVRRAIPRRQRVPRVPINLQ
jgi:hypothetical protein